MDMPDIIAVDIDHYVQTAIAIASDINISRMMAARLKHAKRFILDNKKVLEEWEGFFMRVVNHP